MTDKTSEPQKKEKCEHEWIDSGDPCYCDEKPNDEKYDPHVLVFCKKCGLDKCRYDYGEEIRQQTRKETAKEICNYLESKLLTKGTVEENEPFNDLIWIFIDNIIKKYGVE